MRNAARRHGCPLAGNICNTKVQEVDDQAGDHRAVRAVFEEQIGWAVDEGADMLITEMASK